MDAGTTTSLIGDLGYVIPTGITGAVLVCFVLYARWQEAKQDKDRAEHMAKWDSMIATQKETMLQQSTTQKHNIEALIASYEKQFAVILDTQQRESDRHFKLYERNVSALEALTHNLGLVVKEKTL